jgi:hypothetical protein
MSITRLQQARQMYAMGQRVAKTLDGSRPGYRGSDMATVGTSSRAANTSAKNTSGADYGGGNQGGGGSGSDGQGNDYSNMTGQDIRNARRDFDVGVAGGYAKDSGNMFIGPMPYGTTIDPYQQFRSNRPKVNIPNFGLSGMFLNLFNKGVNSPIQKFADFSAEKNRNYFMDEVVRAGKIPDLDYGTVSEMTNEELEAAYKNYLSDRLNNKTDAYGNPNPGYDDGGEGANQGIATLYNYNMFDDTEENANDPFASRFLQNQPDDIREGIESRMQNYYTV